MRGDFSRLPADSGKYSAVLLQQGRVLVDADWNSAAGSSLWAQRALAADIIGSHGARTPISASHPRWSTTTDTSIWG
jgi:hypothetical protein